MNKCIISVMTLLCLILSACGNHKGSTLITFAGIESFNYEVLTEQFTVYTAQSQIKIHYPSFTHGTQTCTEVNRLVECVLDDYLGIYGDNISNLTLNADYEIMYANDKIVSIVFRGTSNVRTAAHPVHFAFSVNILMEPPKIAKKSSIININDTLAKMVIACSKAQGNKAIEKYFEQFTVDEVRGMLRQEDVSFYLTGDSIGVLLPVPHPIGDYIEFQIPISKTD